MLNTVKNDLADVSSASPSWQDERRDTWCVTSVMEQFDWLKKQPVNQVPFN